MRFENLLVSGSKGQPMDYARDQVLQTMSKCQTHLFFILLIPDVADVLSFNEDVS